MNDGMKLPYVNNVLYRLSEFNTRIGKTHNEVFGWKISCQANPSCDGQDKINPFTNQG
jgi:hypothetical protein